jgi:iron complex outermembrane receptor protein
MIGKPLRQDKFRPVWVAIIFIALGRFAFSQQTQSTSPLSAESSESTTELSPIVVTGSSVGPAESVTSFDDDDVQDANLQSVSNFVQKTPNASVNTRSGFPGTTFTVRGVSESTLLLANDIRSSVAQYIDDIPSIDTLSRDLPLFNIASADFYRGPQETYFGAPSPAGALNIYTVSPTDNWSGNADYQYGSYDFQQVQATVNAPLIKGQLYLGFAGTFAEQDGYISNPVNNSKIDGYQKRDGLLRLIWKPDTNLEIGLYGGLGDQTQSNFYDILPISQQPNPDTLPSDFNGYSEQRNNMQALRIVWNSDDFRLLSVTSRHAQSISDLYNASYIADELPLNAVDVGHDFTTETYTQELRAESTDPNAKLQWRTGFFFSDRRQTGDNQNDIYNLPFLIGAPGQALLNVINNAHEDDYALYGQGTYRATDQLDFTLGLRGEVFSEESTSGLRTTSITPLIIGTQYHSGTHEGTVTDGTWLPSAQATWHWDDSQSTWFKVDKAWRPGGVGIYEIAPGNYSQETSWNFELGHTVELWDRRLSITPVLFFSDYHDYLSDHVVNPVIIYQTNAKYASARGGEITVNCTPTPGLDLSTSFGYTDARYDEFGGNQDNGNPIANIPEYTMNNSATYRYAITKETDLMARLDYDIVGDFYALSTQPNYLYQQGAYGLLSAKVGYEFPHGGLYFFGANLTDSHYLDSIEVDPSLVKAGNPGAPATLGVELSLNF